MTGPAFFHENDDGLIVGNDAARGPWDADACHAGPVTAVIARAFEGAVADKQLVRITVTFQRPIPMTGFRVAATVEREGRVATSASAALTDGEGRVCAAASSLHLATGDAAGLPTATLPAPDIREAVPGGFPIEEVAHDLPFFNSGIEVAYPPGESAGPGPKTVWMRTIPIVAGATPSPFESLCPLADCGNGISRNTGLDEAYFVNPDLTVACFRLPESDWLASSALSFWEPHGIGLSQAQLFDTRGPVGYALQTLVVRRLEK